MFDKILIFFETKHLIKIILEGDAHRGRRSFVFLVLQTTHTKAVRLIIPIQVRVSITVIQIQIVRIRTIVLCRTPEVRVIALIVERRSVGIPVARRQRREAVQQRV